MDRNPSRRLLLVSSGCACPEVSGRWATTSPVVTAGFYAVSMPSQKASGDK